MVRAACVGALLAAAVASAGCQHRAAVSASGNPAEADEGEKLEVRAQPAEKRTIRTTVYGLGRCEALPGRIATLTPALEGRVAGLLAKQGAAV